MRVRTSLVVERLSTRSARIIMTAHQPGTRTPVNQMTLEADQATARAIVIDLCRFAGLPAPWRES